VIERLALLAVGGALLAACSTSTVPPGASTSTSVPASVPCGIVPSPEITFMSKTEPCSISVSVGANIHLRLDSGILWSNPMSDAPAVRVTNIQRPAKGGGLQADLKTVAVGQATVSSAGGIACPPRQPCPAIARVWSLKVTVSNSRVTWQGRSRHAARESTTLWAGDATMESPWAEEVQGSESW
jgi:hypothetical protein